MGMTALCSLLTAHLIQVRGEARFGFLVRSAVGLLVFGSVLYWLFLGLFHDPLVTWFYGKNYEDDAYLLWIMGLTPICAAVISVMNSALWAFERPDRVFWPSVFSAASALALGPFMISTWGVSGAVLMYVVCLVLSAGATTYLLVAHWAEGGEEHKAS
jgi:O-antigen/teichoic acid export membrane protein